MHARWLPREVIPAVAGVVLLPLWVRVAERFVESDRAPDLLAGVLVVVAAGVLLLRRRRPLVTLAVVTVAVAGYLALGYPYGPVLLTFLLATYSVARHLPLRSAAPAVGVALLLLLSHVLVRETAPTATSLTIGAAWAIVPFAVGVAVRQGVQASVHAREAQLQARVDAERMRLSRDVHDVVGHGLAAIHLQASVALRSAGRDDPAARVRVRDALAAIESASAASLAELRGVLHRLPEDDQRAPVPGLDGLADLAERMSAPGAPVRLRTEGDTAPDGAPSLSPAAGLALYRVAQEALTNAVRHGGGGPVEVVLRIGPDAAVLTVDNAAAGDATPDPVAGIGLPGMRDRLAAVGGTFEITRGAGRHVLVASVPRQEDP